KTKFFKTERKVRIFKQLEGATAYNGTAVRQYFISSTRHNFQLLQNFITGVVMKQSDSKTIIFVNTKQQADILEDALLTDDPDLQSAVFARHGDMKERLRETILRNFETGDAPILITTPGFDSRRELTTFVAST
ncbi:P-loop containing nucleoside triphosphate hydrolase protein, partial [Neofusicoccum parvum]